MSDKYVAFTPREGFWAFTSSDSPGEAIEKLVQAIAFRQVLSYPFDNPISFRVVEDHQHARSLVLGRLNRRDD